MKEIITRQVGQVHWQLYPDYDEGLQPIFEEIEQSPASLDQKPSDESGSEFGSVRFRLVREYPEGLSIHAIKTSHPGLAGELWVKAYQPILSISFKSLMEWLRLQSGRSLLDREWKMAREHHNRELPIPNYLAMGKKFQNRRVVEQYLILESLALYQTFDQYYRYTFRPAFPEQDVEKKRGLVRELAYIARKMHDEGVFRPDLKPSQIVLASREHGLTPVLTGPEQARIIPPGPEGTPLSKRVEALARLDSNFGNLFNQSYRLRFFREYFRPDDLTSEAFKKAVKEIMARSEELSQARWRTVGKNIIHRREPYYWFRTRLHRIYIKGMVYENSLVEMVPSLAEAARGKEPVRIKMVGNPRPVDARVLECPPRLPGENGFRSGALHGMTTAAFLDERGIPHLEALAAVEARSRIKALQEKGYLIIRQPEAGCLNLAEHLARKVADEFSGLSWDRSDLISLANFLRCMHQMNLVYSPASGTDIWVCSSSRLSGTDTRGILFLFANPHHLRIRRHISIKQAARHLAELFHVLPISEADESMILKEYLRFSRTFRNQHNAFLADFHALSQEIESSTGVGP